VDDRVATGGCQDITLRLLDALVVVGVLPAKFRQRFREDGVVQATAADQRLTHFKQLADQQVLHLCPDVSKKTTSQINLKLIELNFLPLHLLGGNLVIGCKMASNWRVKSTNGAVPLCTV
jgi:hypothetical protein